MGVSGETLDKKKTGLTVLGKKKKNIDYYKKAVGSELVELPFNKEGRQIKGSRRNAAKGKVHKFEKDWGE